METVLRPSTVFVDYSFASFAPSTGFSAGSANGRRLAGMGCRNSLAAIICIRAVSYRYFSDWSRSGSCLANHA